MIADLDETLRQLLVDELPVKNGDIDISFDLPRREWSSRLAKPTINLYLYDVRENNVLRQPQWERVNGSSTMQAQLKRTPMRVDCSYFVTAWAADPEDEHRMLTRSLLALFRYPVLPDHRLVGQLKKPPYEIRARVAQHDVLKDPSDLWNVLDNEMRAGVTYVVTLALDPWTEITESIVRTRTLHLGQTQGLLTPTSPVPDLVPGTGGTPLVVIGGVICDAATGAPQAGIEVALNGTGYAATTDSYGRYRLGSMPPGGYTLVVWPREGKPIQKEIKIPGEPASYDMEV
jgi:hypothetical protein